MDAPFHLTRTELSKILAKMVSGLTEILGDQLGSVYLYGSYARGDAYAGSDIDVLIVIDGEFDYLDLLEKTSLLNWNLSLENDVVISRAFISSAEFDSKSSPFLMNVHREAVAI